MYDGDITYGASFNFSEHDVCVECMGRVITIPPGAGADYRYAATWDRDSGGRPSGWDYGKRFYKRTNAASNEENVVVSQFSFDEYGQTTYLRSLGVSSGPNAQVSTSLYYGDYFFYSAGSLLLYNMQTERLVCESDGSSLKYGNMFWPYAYDVYRDIDYEFEASTGEWWYRPDGVVYHKLPVNNPTRFADFNLAARNIANTGRLECVRFTVSLGRDGYAGVPLGLASYGYDSV